MLLESTLSYKTMESPTNYLNKSIFSALRSQCPVFGCIDPGCENPRPTFFELVSFQKCTFVKLLNACYCFEIGLRQLNDVQNLLKNFYSIFRFYHTSFFDCRMTVQSVRAAPSVGNETYARSESVRD